MLHSVGNGSKESPKGARAAHSPAPSSATLGPPAALRAPVARLQAESFGGAGCRLELHTFGLRGSSVRDFLWLQA